MVAIEQGPPRSGALPMGSAEHRAQAVSRFGVCAGTALWHEVTLSVVVMWPEEGSRAECA